MADHSLKNELFRPAGGTSWKEPLIKSHSEAEPLVSRTAVRHCREGRPLPSCRLICWQLCRACPVLSELSGPIPMPLQPARGFRCASTDSTGSSVRSASWGLNRPFGAGCTLRELPDLQRLTGSPPAHVLARRWVTEVAPFQSRGVSSRSLSSAGKC